MGGKSQKVLFKPGVQTHSLKRLAMVFAFPREEEREKEAAVV